MSRRALFIILFILAPFFAGFSFAQSPSYFPHVVILKFESGEQLRAIKAKTGSDPKNRLRTFLAAFGTIRMAPLLNAGIRNSIRLKTPSQPGDPGEELTRIYEVRYLSDADPAVLAAKISRMPGIEYAEPKYIRYMQEVPEDPVDNPYLNFHNFAEAWNITHGDSVSVVIAIVDGGVNYNHPELDGKLWINGDEIPASVRDQVDQDSDGTIFSGEVQQYLQQNNEDYNGDGNIMLEDALHPGSPLTTGSDTDSNGFADDLFGWNFWASGGLSGEPPAQNNNPISDGTEHGTHVAGIAAAETNNDQGIYAAGYDVRYMAVKAGGTPEEPEVIGFGFDGIMYAVQQGADIINCSWGGPGFSEAEQDLVEFAVAGGSLVVAAAGNESVEGIIYPAAFNHVLSVGAVETNNRLADYSNYGYSLDVLATGTAIRSTVGEGEIATNSGTSMSTPVVSGLAGLIKSIHLEEGLPLEEDWSVLRIAAQIQASAVSIDNNNPPEFANKLGEGKIDALNAVNINKPGIMVEAVDFVNQDGEKLAVGEDGFIEITAVNYGNATQNLVFSITSLNEEGISLGETTIQTELISTGDTTAVSFGLTILDTYNLSNPPTFRLDFSDNSAEYSSFDILQYQDILFDVVAANNLITSFAGDGTIGFTEPSDRGTGVGFIPREPEGSGDNLLFEGGLMMQANGEIYDAVRSDNASYSRDFHPEQVFSTETPGSVSAQDGYTRFSIADSANASLADIELQTYAFTGPGRDNVVYLKYTVTNTSEFALLKDVYLGLFNDWDIGSDASANSIAFSAQDSILYLFEEEDPSEQPLVAVAQLGPVSSILGINNAIEGRQDSVIFGLYDEYTDAEKKLSLHAGIANTEISGADVSAVVASGPYTLDPNASVVVGFVYAFGEDLNTLRTQIRNAREQAPFESSATGRAVSGRVPPVTRLFQNYPNPFSNTTYFRVDLQEASDVTLTMYDVLGRKVRVLVDGQLEARTHIFSFTNRRLASGVYFLRLKTDKDLQTIPMTLIK